MTPMLKSKKVSQRCKKSEDLEWVLEGIVGYLKSPAWNVPIMNFFDDNCSCFEDKEENKLEYTAIHIKYKTVVEELVAQYIKELHISEDLFSQACGQHTSTIHGVEGMFEKIWAADDFLLFKRLMIKHNLELEMQALNLIQIQDGYDDETDLENLPFNPKYMHLFEPSTSHSSETKPFTVYDDKQDLREVLDISHEEYNALVKRSRELEEKEAMDLKMAIEFSKLEMERLNAQAEEERRMLEEAIRLSLEFANLTKDDQHDEPTAGAQKTAAIVPTPPTAAPTPPTVAPTPTTLAPMPAAKSSISNSSQKSSTSIKILPSLPPVRQKSSADAALDWLSGAQQEASSSMHTQPSDASEQRNVNILTSSKPGIDPADLARRKQYLQEQRDKLLAAKKKKREEDLLRYQSESPELKQDKNEGDEGAGMSSAESEKRVNARRALAERLKREVIQKKK